MDNNQVQTPQQQPMMQTPEPAAPRKSHVLVMVLGGVVLLGLGFLGGYFLFGNKTQLSNQTETVVQISPTSAPEPTTDVLSEINGFPVYTGANFVNKETKQSCTGNESGFSTCGSTTYTWQTPDDYMKVNNFFMNDTSKSGWKCSGGAGAVGGPRDATTKTMCKKGTMSYSLSMEANATETKIILAIPSQTNKNASDEVVGLNETCLGRTNRICATGLKCEQPPQSAADAPGICVKE